MADALPVTLLTRTVEGDPIADVSLRIEGPGGDTSATTDDEGRAEVELAPGGYEVTATRTGFAPTMERLDVREGRRNALVLALNPTHAG